MKYGDEIAGLTVLTCKPREEILNEYLLGDTTNVGILDSIMVEEKFRGSGLQIQIMNYIEKHITKYKINYIAATIHSDNIYSLNNFKKLDYEIINKINIHNGIRYILLKKFSD